MLCFSDFSTVTPVTRTPPLPNLVPYLSVPAGLGGGGVSFRTPPPPPPGAIVVQGVYTQNALIAMVSQLFHYPTTTLAGGGHGDMLISPHSSSIFGPQRSQGEFYGAEGAGACGSGNKMSRQIVSAHQTQLILTRRQMRYHSHLWDHCPPPPPV